MLGDVITVLEKTDKTEDWSVNIVDNNSCPLISHVGGEEGSAIELAFSLRISLKRFSYAFLLLVPP
jgi:hypothetical protein